VIGAAYSLDLLRTQITAIKDKDDNCKTYQSEVDAETAFQRQNANILQWVSPIDPMLMHEGIVARTKIKANYTDSGEWLLTSTEFVDWDNENGKSQVIWHLEQVCPCHPSFMIAVRLTRSTVGTGKTTLM
jgi:hypothetical protein